MNDETNATTNVAPTESADGNAAAARIRQLLGRVKELEARVVELEPIATSAEKWRAAADEARQLTKSEREALRIEREIMAAGILDAEGAEYVQHAYSRLPADGRPPLTEWLANREGLPKAVRAYLSEATATPSAPAVQAPPAPPAPNTSARTVATPPHDPQAWSPAVIQKMPIADFEANLPAIRAILRGGA